MSASFEIIRLDPLANELREVYKNFTQSIPMEEIERWLTDQEVSPAAKEARLKGIMTHLSKYDRFPYYALPNLELRKHYHQLWSKKIHPAPISFEIYPSEYASSEKYDEVSAEESPISTGKSCIYIAKLNYDPNIKVFFDRTYSYQEYIDNMDAYLRGIEGIKNSG